MPVEWCSSWHGPTSWSESRFLLQNVPFPVKRRLYVGDGIPTFDNTARMPPCHRG